MLTRKSRLKDVYANPIGRDILDRAALQLNISKKVIANPFIRNLRLKTLPKLLKRRLSEGFVDTLLTLLNTEQDTAMSGDGKMQKAWWKEAVFYQIYPRSFKDSNGDGIGDLQGIISKLDYIKELGIDAIWLSPIYDSPNDDNGYDIRDYNKIMTEFGTMEDFEELVIEVHKRDMKLIMDLVVNHTSDEHEWYQKAVKEPESKYRDYYIFQDKPNNWTSFFSGSAWNYVEERQQYALHLFSKKQMDLNWENENLRQEIHEMVKTWLEKGVDGFRLDVINYISKRNGLPDGSEDIGRLMGYYGAEHYFYGPRLHEYLREMNEKVFRPYNAFSVGETPGTGLEMSKLLTADYRYELDMVFSFDHLETPGHTRFDEYQYDLGYLKSYMIYWMENYGNHCQPSLFYENHDNPRMISKINADPQYRIVLGKLLAVIQLTLRGTPFIYQGQELGMVNQDFHTIEELRDVESLNLYNKLCKTMGKKEAFAKILAGTRDHARTPMQWNNQQYAGFSDGEPWIRMDEDYKYCNVESQLQDEDSILHFYQELLAFRKEHSVIYYGEVCFTNKKEKDLFIYYRKDETETLCIEINLGSYNKKRKKCPQGVRLLSNYAELSPVFLRPYEASIWKQGNK
ncbi:oligo-1,6-glucosidase [Anaerocolumna cellulosilytica]|uniref:Oligo-1,6-glucosidase n=1 Tax=Anaerocolumna cellulosilytica TaxID=433286 RepID=A0A6S6QT75_9FIRM|nr:alpha-glucosidase [Anaerocolumna cellulosilytica]MBB5195570.1 oligo-1,6-glucosidase [Anaerocolumna cellulosilytica]BCJ93814.1 oligo-1,6-glucosidase [Anaerocolumna cellulosilytica]